VAPFGRAGEGPSPLGTASPLTQHPVLRAAEWPFLAVATNATLDFLTRSQVGAF